MTSCVYWVPSNVMFGYWLTWDGIHNVRCCLLWRIQVRLLRVASLFTIINCRHFKSRHIPFCIVNYVSLYYLPYMVDDMVAY